MGADLVGKIEAGIPEDDPRNPAVIADNVGDNVGDCAGMAADLFETYAVTAVAVMLLGVLTFQEIGDGRDLPARDRRRLAHRLDHRHLRRAQRGRQRGARALPGPDRVGRPRGAAFLPITLLDDGRPALQGGRLGPAARRRRRAHRASTSGSARWSASASPRGLFVITDYYTSTRFRPVRTTARASQTGHATNIIQGLAQGFQSTAAPAILLALGILGANELAGIYGIGVAVMAQLSLCRADRGAGRLRADHRQRRRHRRDGGPAGGGPQRHRPARRGRQHHQGGDEGLRDRLGRARGAGAVRRLRRGAARGGGQAGSTSAASSTSPSRRC